MKALAHNGLEVFIILPSTFIISPLGVFRDRGKGGEALLAIVLQWFQTGCGHGFGVHQEFQPIGSLIEFFEAVADFGDEFGFGAGAVRLPVVGSDRGAGAEHLFS